MNVGREGILSHDQAAINVPSTFYSGGGDGPNCDVELGRLKNNRHLIRKNG
jgi:hypothetical protein